MGRSEPRSRPESHSGTINVSGLGASLDLLAALHARVWHGMLEGFDGKAVTRRPPRDHQDQRIRRRPAQHGLERRAVQEELRAAVEQSVRQVQASAG